MKDLSFSPRAEARLEQIVDWTLQDFSVGQAEAYLERLQDHCKKLANGLAHHQSCRAVFAEDLREDLRFTRIAQHYVVFVETDVAVMVVDFVHQRMDLGGVVKGQGSQ